MSTLVIFDTNAYVDFVSVYSDENVRLSARKLADLEIELGYEAHLHAIVLAEIFAHFNGRADHSFGRWRQAAIAAYAHGAQDCRGCVKVVPRSILEVAKIYLGTVNSKAEKNDVALGSLAYLVSQDSSDDALLLLDEAFSRISAFIDKGEADFQEHLDRLIKLIDPTANNWSIFSNDPNEGRRFRSFLESSEARVWLSEFYIRQAAIENGVELDQSAITRRANDMAQKFAVPLNVWVMLLSKMASGGYNMSNPKTMSGRLNTFWDIDILFSVTDLKRGGKNTVLVTGEEELHKAAQSAELGHKVLKLSDYLDKIRYLV